MKEHIEQKIEIKKVGDHAEIRIVPGFSKEEAEILADILMEAIGFNVR